MKSYLLAISLLMLLGSVHAENKPYVPENPFPFFFNDQFVSANAVDIELTCALIEGVSFDYSQQGTAFIVFKKPEDIGQGNVFVSFRLSEETYSWVFDKLMTCDYYLVAKGEIVKGDILAAPLNLVLDRTSP